MQVQFQHLILCDLIWLLIESRIQCGLLLHHMYGSKYLFNIYKEQIDLNSNDPSIIFSMIFSDEFAGSLLSPALTYLTGEDNLFTMFAILYLALFMYYDLGMVFVTCEVRRDEIKQMHVIWVYIRDCIRKLCYGLSDFILFLQMVIKNEIVYIHCKICTNIQYVG